MISTIAAPTNLRDAYETDGFIVVRNLFDPGELAATCEDARAIQDQFRHLISTKNLRCRWQDNVFTGDCQFDAFDPIIDLSSAAARLAADQRIHEVLREVYGEPGCLFKDKLIFKMPGAKGYDLHQDWIAWERFPRSFLSLVIPLDPTDEDNGCTIVYPGYHRNGSMTPEDGQFHPLPADAVDEADAVPLNLEVGDIALFGGFTPHRSNANLSDRPRQQLYLSYTKHSDGGELRDRHYDDFRAWLKIKYAEYGKTETYFE